MADARMLQMHHARFSTLRNRGSLHAQQSQNSGAALLLFPLLGVFVLIRGHFLSLHLRCLRHIETTEFVTTF